MQSWREARETLRAVGSVQILEVSKANRSLLAGMLGSVPGDWQTLTPRPRETARSNTLSSRYGLDAFPWHTDGAAVRNPPRYVLLHAVVSSSTPTELIHVDRHGGLLEVLRGTTLRATDQRDCVRYLRAAMTQGSTARYRWDPRTCTPTRAREAVLAAVDQFAPDTNVQWTDGKMVVIDNWRVFHRRPAVSDHRTRQLDRLYIHDRGAP